jgi:uroporphyrinogen decarboxylase
MMDHRTRFLATVCRAPVDRPASWLGLPVAAACPGLFRHFGVASLAGLRQAIDDDIYPVELPYHSDTSDAVYMAFDFARNGTLDDAHRTLTAPGFFADYGDPTRIDEFPWPDPALYIDPEACGAAVAAAPAVDAVLGVVWSAHFQDACAAFGMETALVKMVTEPEMYRAIDQRITEFYLRANDIFYRATKGRLDAVLIGNDFGSQRGLMLSPRLLRQFVWPSAQALIDQAHSYGLQVIYHSCGAICDVIPDLIALGVDVIHPIQALAANMDASHLHDAFAEQVSFCGGVDAQELLVNGGPSAVRAKVREFAELFPTGLIVSPSHEAILPDIDPANIEALFAALHEQ